MLFNLLLHFSPLSNTTIHSVSILYPTALLLMEKAMAPHSSTLAWKIPWMEKPGGLQSMGSLRVGHDWATSLWLFTFVHWRRTWQPTPVFLPGESQGRGSLVGCRLGGRTESDTTEAAQQQQQQNSWKSDHTLLCLRCHSFIRGTVYFMNHWVRKKMLLLDCTNTSTVRGILISKDAKINKQFRTPCISFIFLLTILHNLSALHWIICNIGLMQVWLEWSERVHEDGL